MTFSVLILALASSGSPAPPTARPAADSLAGSCDLLPAEGDRLTCFRSSLEDYRQEIEALTRQLRSRLPSRLRADLDASARTWRRHLSAETVHLAREAEIMGTSAWVGAHAELVGMARARRDYLRSLLPPEPLP